MIEVCQMQIVYTFRKCSFSANKHIIHIIGTVYVNRTVHICLLKSLLLDLENIINTW